MLFPNVFFRGGGECKIYNAGQIYYFLTEAKTFYNSTLSTVVENTNIRYHKCFVKGHTGYQARYTTKTVYNASLVRNTHTNTQTFVYCRNYQYRYIPRNYTSSIRQVVIGEEFTQPVFRYSGPDACAQ